MDLTSIRKHLNKMEQISNDMTDDIVPKSFRNAVLEIENDLWRDVPNDIIAQANDILKAGFQTNG